MTHSYTDEDWLTKIKCLTVIFACVHSYLSIFLTRIYKMQPHILQLQSYGFDLFISLNLSCAISSLPRLSGFVSVHPPNHVSTHPSIHQSTCPPPTKACIHISIHSPTFQPTYSPNNTPTHPPTQPPPTCQPAYPSYENSNLSADIKCDNGQTHDCFHYAFI
jgi:hypothetical protein